MCKFASFVLTNNREFYLPNSDSHSEIIKHFDLYEYSDTTGTLVVKIEITPNENIKTWPSLDDWDYRVDQDTFPQWHLDDPDATKARAIAALVKRSKIGFATVKLCGFHKLTSLTLSRTSTLKVTSANKLATITAPKAKNLCVLGAPLLTKLDTSAATDLTVCCCKRLTKIVAPKAKNSVNLTYNATLAYVSAEVAEVVNVKGCKSLTKVYAPSASVVYITGTPKNIKIKAKKGARIYRGNSVTIAK